MSVVSAGTVVATSDDPAPSQGRAGDRAVGLLLVVISACSFGSGALFARPVYASGLDWLTLLAWRFLLGAAVSWVWIAISPARRAAVRRLSRRRMLILLGLGIFYVTNTATYYAALQTVSASLAALIVYIYPAIVAVLSFRFGRRLEGRRPWVALALATVGVGLAVGGIDPERMPPALGLLLALASPIFYSVWIVLSARLAGERSATDQAKGREVAAAREDTDPATAAAVMMTATFVLYWVAATVTGRPVTPGAIPSGAWVGLLGVGIVSAGIAVQTFYAGARRIGAANASLASTIEPVYTIALATILFGESLTPVQIAGGVLVIGGVLLAQTAPGSGVAAPAGHRVSAASAGEG